MRCSHQCAERRKIALFERRRGVESPADFRAPRAGRVRDSRPGASHPARSRSSGETSRSARDLQSTGCQQGDRLVALLTPRVVFTRGDAVLDHGVADDEAHVGRQRQGADSSERQSSSSACPARPWVATNWSMMPQRAPTNAFSARWHASARLSAIDRPADRVEQRKSHRDLERRRGAEPRAARHVARHEDVGARHVDSFAHQLRGHAEDVVAPAAARLGAGRPRDRSRRVLSTYSECTTSRRSVRTPIATHVDRSIAAGMTKPSL